MAMLGSDSIARLSDLWLDGAPPSESDLRAAKSIAAKMAEFEGLKPFPVSVQRLVDYVSMPEFKLDRVRELIEADPVLAARIMRVANSAAYRAYEACTSVSRAVIRIGAMGVVELAMGMAAMGLFEDLTGVGRKVRDHSAGTAAVARELAFRLEQSNLSSKVFLAGLLHDIGKLLMLQSGDKEYAALVARDLSPNSWHLKERELLGFDHGQLGAHMLRVWNLPQSIPQIVAAHHLPKADQGNSAFIARAVDILRVADGIEWLLSQGTMADSPQCKRLANSPDGVRAGLTEGKLSNLWEDLLLVRHEAISIFR
jgi:putative nucleotidyltransferase with HDIG domain